MGVAKRAGALPLLQILIMTASNEAVGHVAVRSQLGEWRRFITVLLLILSPVLIVGIALEALAWRVGETMPMSWTSRWQDAAPDRVWRGGDGHSYLTYKLARIADLKPEVIALGPGRANSFRGDLLAPYSFYNAGLTAWTFDQYRRFLELVSQDGYTPKALIFNLDYWMFSSGFDHYWVDRFDLTPSTHVADMLRLTGQLHDDPGALWRALPETDHVHGLYALLSGDGFHADGSLPATPGTSDPQRLADDGTDAGVPPVVLSEHIADEQIAQFEKFAALAKAKHVALIGVQLPYYEKILTGLNGNPQAGIWREFENPEWQQRFAAAGVTFFDFADMPGYRGKPEYFKDSLDPDARLVDHVMRLMLADPRVGEALPKAKAPEAK
jgi:hypothetical protein